MSKAVLIDESLYGCYTKGTTTDEEGNTIAKVYSTYQRNEVAQRWEKDGKIFITVRPKTMQEAEKVRKDSAEALKKAIEEGRAVKDRVGRIKWIKH